jgi:cytochrome P450
MASSGPRDARKTADFAASMLRPLEGARMVGDFAGARELLRSGEVRQAGAEAEHFADADPKEVSVFFLDGEEQRKKRADLARFFTPKAIETRYRKVMEATSDRIVDDFRKTGRARLDLLSFQLAAEVAAEIVGLTHSDPVAMARRIRKVIETTGRQGVSGPRKLVLRTLGAFHSLNFFLRDIRPAIRERRRQPREDILSHLVSEGCSNLSIYIECFSYGTGGMLTTREFIVMSAWHLLENDELRETFLAGGDSVQLAILDEILRLEPVSGMIQRSRASDDSGKHVLAIDVRAANTDEAITGPNPLEIDPERAKRQRMTANWMSFGDGPHRCPGAQVALHETRVFLDRLLRVPGIRLSAKPRFGWWQTISSYELRGAMVECERQSPAG